MGRMRFCKACSDYTLSETCKKCEKVTAEIGPAKFSPEDRYGKYRRRLKKENAKKNIAEE